MQSKLLERFDILYSIMSSIVLICVFFLKIVGSCSYTVSKQHSRSKFVCACKRTRTKQYYQYFRWPPSPPPPPTRPWVKHPSSARRSTSTRRRGLCTAWIGAYGRTSASAWRSAASSRSTTTRCRSWCSTRTAASSPRAAHSIIPIRPRRSCGYRTPRPCARICSPPAATTCACGAASPTPRRDSRRYSTM